MTRRLITTLLALALVAGIGAHSASASTPRERALAKQVRTLKAQNAKLKAERNAARMSLATCQQGTVQAISTMTPRQLVATVLPTSVAVFEAWRDGYNPGDSTASGSGSTTVGTSYDSWSFYFDLTQWK